jgi:hypothetical protein
VLGHRFDLSIKKMLSQVDFDVWFAEMAKTMPGPSLAVYRSTISNALLDLHCPHGGWGEGGDARRIPVDSPSQGPTASIGDDFFDVVAPRARSVGGFEVGFKLSVCQKSLSLALKHSFAHGLIPMPPICPVDRIILDRASAITGRPWFVNWTEVNDMADYDRHIEHLRSAAGFRSLAAWELISFENLLPRVNFGELDVANELALDEAQRIPQAIDSFLLRFGVPKGATGGPGAMLKDALRSSLQHNSTYKENAPAFARVQVRQGMRDFIVAFIRRWRKLPADEQTFEVFREAMLKFRHEMNRDFGHWFR